MSTSNDDRGVGAPGPPTPPSSTPDCEAPISSVVMLV